MKTLQRSDPKPLSPTAEESAKERFPSTSTRGTSQVWAPGLGQGWDRGLGLAWGPPQGGRLPGVGVESPPAPEAQS